MTDNLEELERLLEERAVAYCYTWAPSRALLRSLIATAREVEGLRAENERLRAMVRPQWFYLGDDQSSDQCRFSVSEVIDEDFFGWGEAKKAGKHLVHVSTAMPGPDIWVVVQVLSDEDKDERGDDEPWIFEEYDSEEAARAALEGAEAPQSPIPLELKPIHFRLLERGANSRYIGLSNNSGVRMGEHAALGQLMRAGLVRFTEDSQPPGPRMPTPCEITDAGRAALNGKGG